MSQPRQDKISNIVRKFYEQHPFPGYENIDDTGTLNHKAKQNLYLRLLDEQLPLRDKIIEIGCGTGQLTNFLGLKGRRIIGVDLSHSSLALARKFQRQNFINSVKFLSMDIFRPRFLPRTFDIAISIGVLHHTTSPREAFAKMVSLIKPGGLIILGLYNPFGRFYTNLRRLIFKIFGRIDILDFYLRQKNFPENKKKIWFKDQYQNPHESQHTVDEILTWYDQENVKYLNSVPSIIPFSPLNRSTRLFKAHRRGVKIEHLCSQLSWVFTQAREGGIFIIIGQKQ